MWFAALKDKYYLDPKWVHLDKCASEIGAVKAMWGDGVKLLLCLWHLDQAIKRRIGDASLPRIDGSAHEIFARAKMEFVPTSVRTPTGGLVTRVTVRKGVCDLMRDHYKYHPFNWFSSSGNLEEKANDIYKFCLQEMYEYVSGLGSSTYGFTFIATGAAHFRVLKGKFLRDLARARLDHLVHVIGVDVDAWCTTKYEQASCAKGYYALPSWEGRFNKMWLEHVEASCHDDFSGVMYITDTVDY
ncbi:hypothetical protein ACHHYP_11352, partial [Achlya hypogyna]